jgi:hypothetical protein
MFSRYQKRIVGGVVFVILAGVVAGCDDRPRSNSNSGQPASPANADALPASLALADAPAGAKDVLAVRKDAKEGDAVVVRGRVGGSGSPFVEGRASMQIVDASLKACGEGTAMDECKTPWDYCCSDSKEIAGHSASVQVVGADGKPLRASLAGFAGLKPLSKVTVKGTVAKSADAGALVINATGVYVEG